jgi:Uncharacterized conserved protein (COG2071)
MKQMALLSNIRGVIDRRILLNYSADAELVQRVLPTPFRPKLQKNKAVVGICMIRFRDMRPMFVPSWMGSGSENAAHRIAAEWEDDGVTKQGVFIPRRDTNSWLNYRLGGRIFRTHFNRSNFVVAETESTYDIKVFGQDGSQAVGFRGHAADQLSSASLFGSMKEASEFFLGGAVGYAATPTTGVYAGVHLEASNWSVSPLVIDEAFSNFFSDEAHFPKGSVELDCALLMRNISHTWNGLDDILSK